MILLAPLAAILAGALAGTAVLALYMLKLRRRPVRVGSILFWERAVRDAQGNVPWRMVRPRTQLLLQLLAIALLALALGRPAVPGRLGGRVLLVIDRSASMNAVDGGAGRTRFEAAREQLRDLAGTLAAGGRARAMVVALGREAVPLTPWTGDRATLLGALDAVRPGDEEASGEALAGLLGLALGLPDGAEPDEAEAFGPQDRLVVVLASDGGLAAPARPMPANVVLRLLPVGGAFDPAPGSLGGLAADPGGPSANPVGPVGNAGGPMGNAGIVAVAAQRLYEDPASVRVFARVLATGPMRRELPVRLALDGRVVGQAVADLTPAEPSDRGPTQATVGLGVVTADGGVLSVLLPGGDLLAADDSASLWLREAARPRVLHVLPDDEPVDTGRAGPAMLVAAVLEAMDLGEYRAVRLGRYEQLAAQREGLPYDVVVFDRAAPRQEPPVASLHFGPAPPLEGAAPGMVAPSGVALPPTRAVSWRRTHPVMRDLTLDQLLVARPLMAPEGQGDGRGGSSGEVVLASGERSPLIVAYEGRRHRRIWVGFEPAQSNWPKLVSFSLFVAEAVDYLAMRGSRDAARGVRAGEMATLTLATPRSRLRLVGPGGAVEVALAEAGDRPAVGPLDRAGVYLLEGPAPGDQRAVAVNTISEQESLVAVLDDLPAAFGGLRGEEAQRLQRGGHLDLWPWFVLAGLLVLAAEWLLSARALSR
ncbi:MAG: VWA domain-containing protein [Phycisphaeraceae bacterium]|nr:VWA domain-containing protein [Phycisphaeraceae bacterium]